MQENKKDMDGTREEEARLLRSIVEMYVYEDCDFFMGLDARHGSYQLFSGKAGTIMPPRNCPDYEKELEGYIKRHIQPEDQAEAWTKMRLAYVQEYLEKAPRLTFTYGMKDAQGQYRRKQIDYRYYDRQRQLILVCRRDITQEYQAQQAQQRALEAAWLQASTDPLTKLWNLEAARQRINDALAQQPLYAVLFLDLDDFKQVNDSHGHLAGDQALCQVAEALRSTTSPGDILGRVGGDEFVVGAAVRQEEEARALADRIWQALHGLAVPQAPGLRLSGSIGMALAPRDGTEYYGLVKAADARLYQAKAQGKDQVNF